MPVETIHWWACTSECGWAVRVYTFALSSSVTRQALDKLEWTLPAILQIWLMIREIFVNLWVPSSVMHACVCVCAFRFTSFPHPKFLEIVEIRSTRGIIITIIITACNFTCSMLSMVDAIQLIRSFYNFLINQPSNSVLRWTKRRLGNAKVFSPESEILGKIGRDSSVPKSNWLTYMLLHIFIQGKVYRFLWNERWFAQSLQPKSVISETQPANF